MTLPQQVTEEAGRSPHKMTSASEVNKMADNLDNNIPPLFWSFERLRGETYVLRPKGELGTMGWCLGVAWQAEFVKGLHKAANRVNSLNAGAEPQHLVAWRKAKAKAEKKAQHASN